MSQAADTGRYHALDGLRAAMMLLGIVLHTGVSYITQPLDVWPYQDAQGSVVFDLLVFVIHLFRMPVFFVMAGFFAALLYTRRGARPFAGNRVQRVVLPLILGWLVLFPATLYASQFAQSAGSTGAPPVAASRLGLAQINWEQVLVHLWFLYYLVIFYTVSLALAPLVARVPANRKARLADIFRAALTSRWRALLFGVPTAVTLYPMEMGLLETLPSLTPPLRILAAYGVFFGFGWALFLQRDLLETFRRGAWKQVALCVPVLVVMLAGLAAVTLSPDRQDARAHLTVVVAGGLATWMLIFALTGLFLRYCERPSATWRYLADASYWLYLTHVPLTLVFPGLLANLVVPAGVKFVIVAGSTLAITVLTYDLFVRSTWIGQLLNGRRYPRSIFRGRRVPGAEQPAAA